MVCLLYPGVYDEHASESREAENESVLNMVQLR